MISAMAAGGVAAGRVEGCDWERISEELDIQGHAVAENLLSPPECRLVAGFYSDGDLFRSRVVMSRHRFGRGEYQYFRYPLPGLVAELRSACYARLVPIADRWNAPMKVGVSYPGTHDGFIERCRSGTG